MPAALDPCASDDHRGRPVVLTVGRSAVDVPEHRWRRTVGSVGLAVAALLVAAGSLAAVGTWVLTGGPVSGGAGTPIWEAPRIVDLAVTDDNEPAVAPSTVVEASQHPAAPATTSSPASPTTPPTTGATPTDATPTDTSPAGTTGRADRADDSTRRGGDGLPGSDDSDARPVDDSDARPAGSDDTDHPDDSRAGDGKQGSDAGDSSDDDGGPDDRGGSDRDDADED